MSLATDGFKADLKEVYKDTYSTTGNAEAALDAFLDAFCDKVEVYIKTAQVVYISGLEAGPYPVTGTFSGRLE